MTARGIGVSPLALPHISDPVLDKGRTIVKVKPLERFRSEHTVTIWNDTRLVQCTCSTYLERSHCNWAPRYYLTDEKPVCDHIAAVAAHSGPALDPTPEPLHPCGGVYVSAFPLNSDKKQLVAWAAVGQHESETVIISGSLEDAEAFITSIIPHLERRHANNAPLFDEGQPNPCGDLPR